MRCGEVAHLIETLHVSGLSQTPKPCCLQWPLIRLEGCQGSSIWEDILIWLAASSTGSPPQMWRAGTEKLLPSPKCKAQNLTEFETVFL